jgi:hypothetical protein
MMRSRTSCKHARDRGGEPLHLSDGSCKGGTRKHREWLATSECTRTRARQLSLRLQRGPLGHDPVLHIAPERDDQFPSQRHEADALTAAARRAKARQEPLPSMHWWVASAPNPTPVAGLSAATPRGRLC